jgi:hypothetical protein
VLVVANHYLSIGFDAPGRMDVVELLRRAITGGTSERLVDGGRFVQLHDPASGARVNVVVDQTGMVRSAKPSFRAPLPRRVRAQITGLHPDAANPDADLVQLAPSDGDYPLAVELEDGCRSAVGLAFGEEADFELVGFADSLECYVDEDAYRASGMPLGMQAVLPAGLLPLQTSDGAARPRATALVSGVVVACTRLHNGIGGAEFLHLVIETAGMTFDVVVHPELVEGPVPEPGHIVTGSLWFVARPTLAAPVSVGAAAEADLVTAPEENASPAGPSGRQAPPRLFSRWC